MRRSRSLTLSISLRTSASALASKDDARSRCSFISMYRCRSLRRPLARGWGFPRTYWLAAFASRVALRMSNTRLGYRLDLNADGSTPASRATLFWVISDPLSILTVVPLMRRESASRNLSSAEGLGEGLLRVLPSYGSPINWFAAHSASRLLNGADMRRRFPTVGTSGNRQSRGGARQVRAQ